MSSGHDVTRILNDAARGDVDAAARLFPLVYEELRKLAAQRMANESPGHTLQPTALVHDAYLRLVDVDEPQRWDGRGHFFAAAAEAMRRILVEGARRKLRVKHGMGRARLSLDDAAPQRVASAERPEALVALDEALDRLATHNPQAAELVKLRHFAGLTNVEAAGVLHVSPRRADQVWAYAKAWLRDALDDERGPERAGP